MLEKHAKILFEDNLEIEALNNPDGWDIYKTDGELSIDRIKIASAITEADLDGFDIKEAIEKHPDHLFVKVFAIKKDEPNDNADSFSEEELKKAAHTFVGCPVFCNHANDDIEKARGKIVHAWYDEKRGGIYIISMVDKIAYPKLARGIEEGYIVGTSMGCQVHHSLCSVCHTKAHVSEEYCEHIKNRKNKKFSGKTKCNYHKSKCKPEDDCPVCGCKKGETKDLDLKEVHIFEHNKGLKFIEDSFVVNPACHDCLVDVILNVPEFTKKVASLNETFNRIMSYPNSNQIVKVAGKAEIDYLTSAMKNMEVVAKSMMDQKDKVSMDYVSDIVKALSDVQTVTDELIEMGYAQLQSPPTLQDPNAIQGSATQQNAFPQSQQNQTQQPQQMPSLQPLSPSSSPVGDIGTVTKPSFASKKIKDFNKVATNLKKIVDEININNSQNNTKEHQKDMSNNIEKTAKKENESQQVTTEKQLDSKLDLHPRNEESINGITESKEQLGQSKEPVNDTTTDSPQVRKGEFDNVTTENQLNDLKNTAIARWDSAPDVITEKTWTEFSRAIGSNLSKDQSEHITESQLKDLLSKHRWTEPNVTTENQLKSKNNWLTEDNAWSNKESAAEYAKAVISSAIESISDSIALYKRTPAEVVKAAKFISKDHSSLNKAAFLTIVNGYPCNKELREIDMARASYFGKLASDISSVDALLACMGDNCSNIKAEDLVEAVRFVATDLKKMATVEEKAKIKLAKAIEIPEDTIIDKVSAFENAFGLLTEKEDCKDNEDGIIEVESSIDEIGDLSDEAAFIAKAEKLAKSHANVKEETVLYKIDVDKESNSVVTTLKLASKLTEDEKAAVKQAQMMGGEMGGGMGGAPGGGATMPQPPMGGDPNAAGAPPAETFQESPSDDLGDEAGSENKEALPPGSICPVCGSEDVDIVEGKGKCNNCGSQFVFKVEVEVTRWTGVNDKNSDENAGNDEAAGMEGEGEGFPVPGEGENPNIPVAAMTRLTPNIIKKVANTKLGSISPLTGSSNTFDLGDGKFLCMDTGVTYQVAKLADKKDPNVVWAEWRWIPKTSGSECQSCRRAKNAWNDALKSFGMTSQDFEILSTEKKANTILEMDKKGLFKIVKTASKNTSVMDEFKKAYSSVSKFPIESCREKLARRYGEDAVSISGPCKGDKIYDCVCNQLKKAGFYSDSLANKVANAWLDRDGCIQCIEEFTRKGYDLEKSALVCNQMKVKYASPEDMLAEEMGDIEDTDPTDPTGPSNGPGKDNVTDDFGNEDPFSNDDSAETPSNGLTDEIEVKVEPDNGIDVELNGEEVDPFGEKEEISSDDGVHGEVTLKLPLSVLDQVEQAIDKAHGIDPSKEQEHNIPSSEVDMNKEVNVEIPEQAADALHEPLENALQKEVGVEDTAPSVEEEIENSEEESIDNNEQTEPSLDSKDDENLSNEIEGNEKDNEMDNENSDASRLANAMRKGKRVGQIDMDLSLVAKLLGKKTASENSEIKLEKAQDSVGKIQNNGTIGNEEKFKAEKPSVPRGNATIGNEPKDLNPNDKPLPKVPSGGGEMGHEKEMGYTSDGAKATGGDAGQGKIDTASTASQTKVAGEKKVGPAKPVSEQLPFEISNNKDLSSTPNEMKKVPFEESDKKEIKNIPEKNEGAFIGDEKNSIGEIPKVDKNAPSIPVGGGRNEKYDKNEKNAPEHETDIKGTVIAENNEKDKKAQTEEATRIAGRMIEEKIIDATQLTKKIAELSRYKVEQLKDIETQMFKSAKKGLSAESNGIEKSPVIISENSNQRSSDLKDKISSLFTLEKNNKLASEKTDADLRAIYGRR